MSRHSATRVPGRLGVLLRQFRSDPWPTLLLALLVALLAAATTLWPRYILDMNSRQVPYQVSALSAQQRDLLANWGSTMVPQPGRTYTSAEDTWGPVLEGLERTRTEQPEPLRSMMGPGDLFIDLGKNDTLYQPPEGTDYAKVAFQERVDPLLEEHVDLVSGQWPEMVLNPSPQLPAEAIPEGTASGSIQVALLDEAAERLNLEPGDSFALQPGDELAKYQLTGTFSPKDPEDPRWAHMPNSTTVGELYSGDQGLIAYVTAYLPSANPGSTGPITNNAMKLFYPIDAEDVAGDEIDQVTAQLIRLTATQQDIRLPATEEEYNTQFNSPDVNLSTPPIQVTFGTESLSTFESLSQQQRATVSILAVVAAGPIGVALAVLALASRLIVSRRQPALALAAARGGSPAQVRGSIALEGLAVAIPAAVAGHYAANLVALPNSGWTEWLPVALMALAPPVLLAMTASTATRTSRRDLSSRGAGRVRVLVEVVVLALAGLAIWRLFDRGLTGVTQAAVIDAPAGADAATQAPAVAVDTGVDLLMAATPVLLALAACVITLRLYPIPVHALMGLFRRRRGLTNFLGAARAVRDPAGGVLPALAVILGVSVAVLSSVLAATINTGAETAAWDTAGADVRMSGPSWDDEDAETVRALDGVEEVALIRANSNTVDITGDITARALQVYVVDSTLPQVWADTPLPALPQALFDTADGTTRVLSGGGFTAGSGSGVLDSFGPVEVIGHVDSLPGVRTRGNFVVVDRAAWEAGGGGDFSGQVMLVAADDPGNLEPLTEALSTAIPNALAQTPKEQLDVFRAAPVTGSMSWLLGAAVIATTVLTVLAVLFVQLMGAAGRTTLFAVLRTLGLSQRQARGLTAWELGPLVAMAFAVGAALGVLVPWLLLKAIDLTGMTGGTSQPILAIDWVALGPVVIGILVVVALAIGVSATLSGRADLVRTLRGGEDR